MDPNQAIRQFNSLAGTRKSLIQKALTSATNVAEPLVPEKLEEIITNTVVRLSPELAVMKSRFDNQKFHEFNRLLTLPGAGGAMGENAVTPTRNSTYARDNVELKVIRRKGAVTNFLQDAAAKYIDAAAAEMENHLLAHVYDMNTYIAWGNELADPYTFGGWDRFVSTNRINEAFAGVVPTTLGFLDEMIDRNLEKQGEGHDRVFLMSARMLSKISSLLTNVRLNQGLTAGGLTQVDIGGGWRLNAYRDIPIIVTSSMRPTASTPMGTVTATGAGSGGAIDNDQYFFMVAPVTYNGEELPSAEANETTSSADTVTLAWSKPTTVQPLYYKIYCGLTTGGANLKLVGMTSAFTYDSAGTITGDVEEYVFTANPDDRVTTEVPAHMANDVPMGASGGVPNEAVALIDLDEYQGMGKLPYTNTAGSRFGGLVTMAPLAQTDDNLPFLIKSYVALADAFEATSVWHRNLRIA
jgi:hypothetical protein